MSQQVELASPIQLCAIGSFEPLLSAIGPPNGGTGGGQTVTLIGAGFAAGAMVTVGGVACRNVQVPSSTVLQCTTGAHAAGVVDVVVTVNSQTGTLTGAYTYAVVNALPGAKPPGPAGSPPSGPPATRPAGVPGGAPNPLPAPRP